MTDDTYITYIAVRDSVKLKQDLDEQDLANYEEQYFDVLKVAEIAGVHRYAPQNIEAARIAGWIIEAPEFAHPLERRIFSDLIDAKYQEYTAYKTHPNGSGG